MIKERCMVDIHTHILPEMDDGSTSVDESLKLLHELSNQGITMVAATPHFYADRENPSEFFDRRQKAVSLLSDSLGNDVTVLPGAEVCYYQGISKTTRLSDFAIGQTNLLLLEMPVCDWTTSVINEIYSIQRDRKLQVVIAHIDRYMSKKNAEYIEDMLRLGVLIQINAGAFLEKKRKKEALCMLKSKSVHFIASDCHNMLSRPPKLNEAFRVIENKLGQNYLEWLWENSKKYFGEGDE